MAHHKPFRPQVAGMQWLAALSSGSMRTCEESAKGCKVGRRCSPFLRCASRLETAKSPTTALRFPDGNGRITVVAELPRILERLIPADRAAIVPRLALHDQHAARPDGVTDAKDKQTKSDVHESKAHEIPIGGSLSRPVSSG